MIHTPTSHSYKYITICNTHLNKRQINKFKSEI